MKKKYIPILVIILIMYWLVSLGLGTFSSFETSYSCATYFLQDNLVFVSLIPVLIALLRKMESPPRLLLIILGTVLGANIIWLIQDIIALFLSMKDYNAFLENNTVKIVIVLLNIISLVVNININRCFRKTKK